MTAMTASPALRQMHGDSIRFSSQVVYILLGVNHHCAMLQAAGGWCGDVCDQIHHDLVSAKTADILHTGSMRFCSPVSACI